MNRFFPFKNKPLLKLHQNSFLKKIMYHVNKQTNKKRIEKQTNTDIHYIFAITETE